MDKVIIAVLGLDRPGIVATVSNSLLEQDCNIENFTQTILQSIFAALIVVDKPDHISDKSLEKNLRAAVSHLALNVTVKRFEVDADQLPPANAQPFIITTMGPDRKGLVAGITRVLSHHGCNITNLKAVFRGGKNPLHNTMIYEVDIPEAIDLPLLYKELKDKASALGLEINIQHRRLFEAINRI